MSDAPAATAAATAKSTRRGELRIVLVAFVAAVCALALRISTLGPWGDRRLNTLVTAGSGIGLVVAALALFAVVRAHRRRVQASFAWSWGSLFSASSLVRWR